MKAKGQHGRHRQQGQALPLVLVALMLTGLLVGGIVRLGVAAAHRQGAQAAADAAALAGAAHGRAAAEELAAANDAQVIVYREGVTAIEITVRHHGATATARARWMPAPIP